MKYILTVLLISLSSFSLASGYIGTQAVNIGDDDLSFNGVNLIAGIDITKNIGIRGRYLLNSDDDSIDGVKVELESVYGVDAVLTFPMAGNLSPYVSIGRTEIEIRGSYGGYSETADDSFTSVGAGIKYDVNEKVVISAEYMRLDSDIDSFGAGIQLNF